MKKNSKLLVVFAVVVLAIVYFAVSHLVQRNSLFANHPNQNAASELQATKTIRVVSSDAVGFAPDVIKVKYGDTVKFVFSTQDETHTFTLPGYGVNQIIARGTTTELEFHATKRGEFVFFCATPCGMTHSSGKLIVS